MCEDAIAFSSCTQHRRPMAISVTKRAGNVKLEVNSKDAVMLKLPHFRATILLLSGTLAFASVACSSINPSQQVKSVSTSPAASEAANSPASPKPVATTAVSQNTSRVPSLYERALDSAQSAATITQSAQSADDWNLALSRWRQAVDLLQAVPKSSPYYAIAKSKIAQYQRYLTYAQKQAIRPNRQGASTTAVGIPCQATDCANAPNTTLNSASPTPVMDSKLSASNPQVFIARIKRRMGGTPIIDVIFNGKHTFEMIVDSGASATVITPAMAARMGVRPETVVIANTASDKSVKFGAGKVQSIAVEGAVVKNVQVAIAGSGLDTGLLGQDFFSNYDIWMKQDIIEFHPR